MKVRLQKAADAMTNRESNKCISLTTSRVNYMDPRITVAFCKKVGIEVKHFFPATMMSKFPWALEVDSNYSFRTDKTEELQDVGPPPPEDNDDDNEDEYQEEDE